MINRKSNSFFANPIFCEPPSLFSLKAPLALIEYMDAENINALEDMACYCSQEETPELLIQKVAETRGNASMLPPPSPNACSLPSRNWSSE